MANLTDLGICKRIAEIEGFDFILAGNTIQAKAFTVSDTFSCCHMGFTFNPLTDDALCFKLMKKHKISLIQHQNNNAVYCIWNHDNKNATSTMTDANRAICLAIIEAHN